MAERKPRALMRPRLRALWLAAGFAITTAPVPDLDRTNLVVGRVVSGAALVDNLAAMPAVRAASDNPFFRCGPAGLTLMSLLVNNVGVTGNYGR